MADSKREVIFKRIEVILKGIQGVGDVSRGKIDALAIQKHPALFIYPGFDDVTEELNTLRTRDMEVFIFGWQRAQKDIALEIEAFLPKVQRAIATDYNLGGAAIDFKETGISERILTEDNLEGGFILNCSCQYRVLRSDPYN